MSQTNEHTKLYFHIDKFKSSKLAKPAQLYFENNEAIKTIALKKPH